MDESGINLNFDLDESDQERILEIVKSDLVDSVLSELPASEFPNFDFYELRSRTVSLSTSLSESPTLKTEVVRSRTQLKQQLMRDQELMKEQERRRIAEEESAIAAESNQEPISIPVNVSNVQFPNHVLQVSSALENPTRYHILAKRKNQVMKYLNSSDSEDFVSKFDAQKATLQMKQQHQQLKLYINQRQQVQDQQKQQIYQKKQFQQQQRILQRRQVQKRREVHLEYQEQWHKTKLEQMENMDYEAKLEHMQLMEYEQVFNEKNHERELNHFQEQQHVEEVELQQQLKAQHQIEQQQLLHRHLMEKQQLQQQFQLEKQQLHHQQEQLKLHQQMLKHQRQKQLQKQAEAEDKAEAEALVKAQAEIRARIRRLLYGEPSSEAETKDDEQKKLQEAAQGKKEAEAAQGIKEAEAAQGKKEAEAAQGIKEAEAAQGIKEAEAAQGIKEAEAAQGIKEAEAEAPKEAQTEEQPQTQLQLLGQALLQEPLEMQDEARALPLEYYSQRDALQRFISDLAQDGSTGDDKSVDMLSYDVCYTMSGNLYGPFQWSLGEPDSLSQDDSLNMKWTRSCPPGLEHYDAELSPDSLHHAKSRIRKDNHNIVERRRRSNINDRIKELADLLPKVNEPYYEVVKDSKNNKGGILKSAVEYIKYLKFEMMRLKQAEINSRRLQEENVALMAKIKEIESKFKEKEMEMLMKHQAWMIVKPHSFDVSVMKDDEMDKNESNESEKSECGSSQCELMEEDDTDEDEIC